MEPLNRPLDGGVPELDVQACLRVFATLEQRLDCVIPGVRDRTAPE